MIKLELNKKYLTRDNQIVALLGYSDNYRRIIGHRVQYPTERIYYRLDGKVGNSEHNLDLIKECTTLTTSIWNGMYFDEVSNQWKRKSSDNLTCEYPGRPIDATYEEINFEPMKHTCVCIMHGPTGLLAVGCTCGGK